MCKIAENYLKWNDEDYFKKFNVNKLFVNVLRRTDKDIFGMNNHQYDTCDGIDNHHYMLVKLIVEIYVDLRNYSICKTKTLDLKKYNNRNKLTKMITYSGE